MNAQDERVEVVSDPVIMALREVSELSAQGDKALLSLSKLLTSRVIEIEGRVEQLLDEVDRLRKRVRILEEVDKLHRRLRTVAEEAKP